MYEIREGDRVVVKSLENTSELHGISEDMYRIGDSFIVNAMSSLVVYDSSGYIYSKADLKKDDLVSEKVRDFNVGDSDYAQHKIQPWDIWEEYDLNPWDADIVKRVLRTKKSQSRKMDYEKIIHICQKRISQIDKEVDKE